MLIWRTTHRRWKRAVEAAMSPVWHLNERDRVAAAVARRVWRTHGGRPWADASSEGSLLLLEAMITKHLSDEVVRASLGWGYLEVLANNICRAEYEDARALAQEAEWVDGYLRKRVRCPLLAASEQEVWDEFGQTAAVLRERLYQALAALSAAELRSAGATPEILTPRW